jgi:hypothetical protein
MAPWRLHRQVAVSGNGQLLMLVSTEQPFSGGVNDIDQALLPEIVESIKTVSCCGQLHNQQVNVLDPVGKHWAHVTISV